MLFLPRYGAGGYDAGSLPVSIAYSDTLTQSPYGRTLYSKHAYTNALFYGPSLENASSNMIGSSEVMRIVTVTGKSTSMQFVTA